MSEVASQIVAQCLQLKLYQSHCADWTVHRPLKNPPLLFRINKVLQSNLFSMRANSQPVRVVLRVFAVGCLVKNINKLVIIYYLEAEQNSTLLSVATVSDIIRLLYVHCNTQFQWKNSSVLYLLIQIITGFFSWKSKAVSLHVIDWLGVEEV
jgi:hypothetical protein